MFYRFGKSYPDELVMLPGQFFEKTEHASETELRVMLSLAPHIARGGLEEEEALALLEESFAAEEVLAALAFWRGCGIFKTDGKRSVKKPAPKVATEKEEEKEPAVKKVIDADEAPFYSSADLAAAAQEQPDFKNLVSFAEGRLEKVMNTSELARLYSFLDYLKMPLDVVILVIEDCASRDKKSLRY
ncbi:MAG: DnaD domain protein, partial [Clostridia bacterium]|nr:DnaD domain protein [Clostridia bacterium]